MPLDRTGDPGQGLESVGHRVLVYQDLIALEPNPDVFGLALGNPIALAAERVSPLPSGGPQRRRRGGLNA